MTRNVPKRVIFEVYYDFLRNRRYVIEKYVRCILFMSWKYPSKIEGLQVEKSVCLEILFYIV